MMVDWIQSPWTQPFGRRDLDEDPPRLVDLPFAFSVTDAFFAFWLLIVTLTGKYLYRLAVKRVTLLGG